MRKLYILIILLVVNSMRLLGQNIDSLKIELKNAQHDTTRCNVLSILTEIASEEEWPIFNEQLKNLAEINIKKNTKKDSLLYLKFLVQSYNNMGYLLMQKGEVDNSTNYYNKCLTIYQSTKNEIGISSALNNIGTNYINKGNIIEAISYYEKSLKIREKIGEKELIAESMNNIASIYSIQGEKNKALEYYMQSIKILERSTNASLISLTYNYIGAVYLAKNDVPKSLDYFFKSLKIREDIKELSGVSESLNNIGAAYNRSNNVDLALEYYLKCLKINELLDYKYGIVVNLNNIAGVYLNKKNYKESLRYALKAYNVNNNIFPENTRNISYNLKKAYTATGDHKNALFYAELYIQMRDSISNRETKKASIRSQLKYEYEKKAAADSVKVAEEKKLTTLQLKQEESQRYFLYAGLLLTLIFSAFMFNRFRIIKKQKTIIEEQKTIVEKQKYLVDEKQKEILDSIRYAKRIQTSLLPTEKYIHRNLKQNS